MRIDPVNPNLLFDTELAAQKARSKHEAEETKNKLSEPGLQSVVEDVDCVVTVGSRQEESEQQPPERRKEDEQQNKEETDDTNRLSDWA